MRASDFTPEQIERFWSRVEQTDGCWLWLGQIGSDGYGRIKLNGRSLRASRVAWTLVHGEIPDDRFALHRCDDRRCVRVDHLFLGDYADNNADMMAKGRQRLIGPANPAKGDRNGSRLYPERLPRGNDWKRTHPRRNDGEYNPRAKLTATDVETIRRDYAAHAGSYSVLARRFGVSKQAIARIIKRKAWNS
jgi:hypothetical protein